VITTTIIATGTATRNPAKMNGAMAGSTTRRSVWPREAPMFCADQRSTRFTPRAPW
jgi:hypothetical protein